jgi:hypothetical protein
MLHAGLDLSRKKVDVCVLDGQGEQLAQLAVPPDADALRGLARRIEESDREPVCAVIESMTGARCVHDTLEQEGWDVESADAQKVKGLAPLARFRLHLVKHKSALKCRGPLDADQLRQALPGHRPCSEPRAAGCSRVCACRSPGARTSPRASR